MAGLRVGQAFGMFLLPGFGVSSSSPWVPGHLTSMCDSGVNRPFSKMAAENSNKLKLAKIKNVYQHWKEHL